MKRLLLAVVAVGLTTSAARTDWGGPRSAGAPQAGAQAPQADPNTLMGAGGPYNGVAPDKYGLNPRLKRLFHIGSRSSQVPASQAQYYPQMGYNQSGPAYNPNGYPPGAYGPAQGTLVFPHQPFTRSPRDFFMLDLNR
ncbi:hypothetical protein J8F10_17635 [Gemmata sp. G18]|uniref:Uncharacterized protein n=1 Tax=Gemmata palustris TaxID=2822762 RepID=A0ABS5BTV1_9BACT|nr:hypothetical protein [Gemmata palustris]MBP3957090.1 hypothetical protein [Gemmata palustris]